MLRLCTSSAGSGRIIAGLQALEREPYAPRLYAHCRDSSGHELIAMEDIDGVEPEPADVQRAVEAFADVLRSLHAHPAFADAVDRVGRRDPPGFEYRRATEQRWERAQGAFSRDRRLKRAAAWLQRLRARPEPREPPGSVQVAGHGDMHLPNWRLTERGPVLLDWEDVRRAPLAVEIAPFIVFAAMDPRDFAHRYGLPPTYAVVVEEQARWCAVHLYLLSLRATLDESRAGPDPLAHVAAVCERWLGP